ncbi:hypothetical protein H4582DRAFT_2083482 [Lactarius indigo]|nr:hypothetical protein H4582DRAFT_2083482 [Lactarius indigo]
MYPETRACDQTAAYQLNSVFRTDVEIAPPEKESLECLADGRPFQSGAARLRMQLAHSLFYPAFQATQPAKLDPIIFDLRFPSSPIRSSLFALLQIFLSYTLEDLRVLRHAHAYASPRPKSSARSTDGLPSSPSNQVLFVSFIL